MKRFELGILDGIDKKQGKLYIQLLTKPSDEFREYYSRENRQILVFVQSLTLSTCYRDIFCKPLKNPEIDMETYTLSAEFSESLVNWLPDDLPKGMTVFVGNARLEEFHEPDWYHNIKKEYYSDLDSCVQYAVSTGNHRAFACYYTECCHSRKDIFNQYFGRFKTCKGNLDRVKILHPKWWRALNLDYDAKLTYKNAVIEKQTIRKWFEEHNIPKRNALLQCAICLGLSGEEANRLLLAAGYEELYPVDVEDAVFGFYLDYYAVNAGKNISSHEKLKVVHDRIRGKLLELCDSGNLHSAMEKQKTEKGNINLQVVLSETPVGKGITDLIEQYKNYQEEKSKSVQSRFTESQSGLTEYVTKTIRSFWPLASPDGKEASDGNAPDPLDRYFAEVQMQCTQSDNSMQSNIFTQRHYGYLRKSVQFFDGYKRYLKNRCDRSCAWDSLWEMWNNPGRKENENLLRPELVLKTNGKEPSQTWKRKALSFIWRRSYYLIPEVLEGSANRSVPLQIIQGRQQEVPEKGTMYEIQLSNKKNLIKYAVATGNEDQTGYYLRLAGYWREDLLLQDKPALITEVSSYDNSGKLVREGQTDYPDYICDRQDVQLIYAIKYRDAVLNARYAMEQDRTAIDQYKEEFPFIELLMDIAHTIQEELVVLLQERNLSTKLDPEETEKNCIDDLIYL